MAHFERFFSASHSTYIKYASLAMLERIAKSHSYSKIFKESLERILNKNFPLHAHGMSNTARLRYPNFYPNCISDQKLFLASERKDQ